MRTNKQIRATASVKARDQQPGDFIYQERQPDGHTSFQNWYTVAEHSYRLHSNSRGYEVRRLKVIEDRERQAAPNDNWCVGCSPDNCGGCGPSGMAAIVTGPFA